jgi:ferredoxin
MAYFSPTGTTKAVVQAIAKGIDPLSIEYIDITKPNARRKPLLTSENELLIVAVPVYIGRVPALLTEWLNTIQACNTPAVCVVVYGNYIFDNALFELTNIVKSRGGIPIACAAYIGEHSFSNSETPIAQGRPYKSDLIHAELFGKKIREKLQSVSRMSDISNVYVPGIYPYGGETKLWDVDFIAVNDQCILCGLCIEVCPVDAIDSRDSKMINKEKCITCCACIKSCPQNARSIKPGPVKDAAKKLNERCKEQKKPEYFI